MSEGDNNKPPENLFKDEVERVNENLWKEEDGFHLNNNPMNRSLSFYPESKNGEPGGSKNSTFAGRAGKQSKSVDSSSHDFVTQAFLEVPITLDMEDGLEVQKDVRSRVVYTIPPVAGNGKWSATLGGSSLIRGPMGCATGSMSASYHLSDVIQLQGGMDIGDQAKTFVGATYYSTGSTSKHQDLQEEAVATRKYTMALYSQPYEEMNGINFSARQTWSSGLPGISLPTSQSVETLFSCDCTTSMQSNGLISMRTIDKSSSTTTSSRLTTEVGVGWWGSLPRFFVGLNPKLSLHKRLNLSCSWGLGKWHVGAVMTQSLQSPIASLGVGFYHSKKRGLCWVFHWNRGDVTVRIPMTIARSPSSLQSALVYPIQVLYVSMLSKIIQDAIADIWKLDTDDDDKGVKQLDIEREHALLHRNKAKHDAEQQTKLMTRQAKARAKSEEENDGLVILHALYQVDGGDELDATIQLQFWTSRGTLELPTGSKKHLLGFYDVTTAIASNSNSSNKEKTMQNKTSWWWSLLGANQSDEEKMSSRMKHHHNQPMLTVRYHFSGNEYEITVKDEEALHLPNPRAKLVKVDQ